MSESNKGFRAEIETALDTAFKSAKGGDEKWNKFMTDYSVVPLSAREKEILLNSNLPIATGAFPIELRRVLEVIVIKYKAIASDNPQILDLVNMFNLDAEIIRYQNKIKPFGGFNNVFKNATSTTKNYSEGIGEAKKSAHRCVNCGAPRLEEMQYDNCMFCGSKLFEATV